MIPPNKIVLTPEQEEYLAANFAVVIHATLCEHIGISKRTLCRLARERGLTKDMDAIRSQQIERQLAGMKKSDKFRRAVRNPMNGFKTRFQPGYNAIERFGEEKFRDMHKRAIESRNRTWREERARAAFGLPRKTKLKVVRQPRAKVCERYYLKKLGYIIDNENNIAYWTETTRRAVKLELKPKFFKYKPYEQDGNICHQP